MSFIGFNVEEFVSRSNDRFWVVGRTPIIIADVIIGVSYAGQPYVKVVIEATEGVNSGRKESLYCMTKHANSVVIQLGKRRLASIARALGITYLEDPVKQFKYQRLVVNVGSRVDKKTNMLVNSFEDFEAPDKPPLDGVQQMAARYGVPTGGRPMTPIDPNWTNKEIQDDPMPTPDSF